MSIDAVLTVIENSAIAHAISKSNHMVAALLQVVHVMGFVTLLAALVLVSLRLLRWSFNAYALEDVVRDADRLLKIGLTLVITSGVLMFSATPQLYFYKPMFGFKMLLFVGAVTLQFTVLCRLSRADTVHQWAVRTVVGISLFAWFGVGFAGRMIGFT